MNFSKSEKKKKKKSSRFIKIKNIKPFKSKTNNKIL